MPHKRKRRIKKHKGLKEMLETDPDSDKLFEQNLLDDFYPERLKALKDVCLYDFVKFYCKFGTFKWKQAVQKVSETQNCELQMV